jgi:hypothetical protein
MAPWKPPFVMRKNRAEITNEPDPGGTWSTKFPEMLGYNSQGGGQVSADVSWPTSPKQWQEELTEEELRQELAPALPAGDAPKP